MDIGIYIADQMTMGAVDDLAPLRFHGDRRDDGVPLAEYQMRLLHHQKRAADYLRNREHLSSACRKVPWTQLSIPLAVQAFESETATSKPELRRTCSIFMTMILQD
jgi:hypothetical protein